MDWFSEWDPGPYIQLEPVDPAVDTRRLTAWLILTVVALIVAALWYRQRVSLAPLVLVRDRRARRRGALPVRACAVLFGIRGSHGDCVRPALPRSQLSRAVAVSARGGDAAAGAARLA